MQYSTDYQAATYGGAMAGFFSFMLIFGLAVSVIVVAGMWKTFEKAGKPGWAAIIPIYNIYVMIEIVGKPGIWLLWCILPCTSFVFVIWLYNLMSKSFGKSEGFTIGLLLFGFIFWPILGFGGSRYLGPSAAEAQNGAGRPFPNPNDPFNQFPNKPQA